MSEEPEQEEKAINEEAEFHARGLFKSIRKIVRDRLSLKDLSDPEKTIDGIQRDVEFRGFNLWILIFSILICSIGLNNNSGAVIIGAMLISPLMGPIMGLGLSVGINDSETLKKSVKSLATMVGVAIITSFVFFFFVPLGSDYSELFARTRPNITDVFVAFFGGTTGILAGSRKEKSNVIPGVAIATALMPPLCTAGYGLATQNWSYFLGASYLFVINSFFIALATMIVVRYLNFPVTHLLSKEKEAKARRLIVLATTIIIVPSIAVFYLVIKETIFNREVETFIRDNIVYDGSEIIKNEVTYRRDSISTIHLVMIGEKIPESTIRYWQRELDQEIGDVHLEVFQGANEVKAAQAEVSKLIDLNEASMRESIKKDKQIYDLQLRVDAFEEQRIPATFSEEITSYYPYLKEVSMGMIYTNNQLSGLDTLAVVLLTWDKDSAQNISQKELAIAKAMKARLGRDTVWVQSIRNGEQ